MSYFGYPTPKPTPAPACGHISTLIWYDGKCNTCHQSALMQGRG